MSSFSMKYVLLKPKHFVDLDLKLVPLDDSILSCTSEDLKLCERTSLDIFDELYNLISP